MKYNLNHPQIKKLINHFKDDDKFNMTMSSSKIKKLTTLEVQLSNNDINNLVLINGSLDNLYQMISKEFIYLKSLLNIN